MEPVEDELLLDSWWSRFWCLLCGLETGHEESIVFHIPLF